MDRYLCCLQASYTVERSLDENAPAMETDDTSTERIQQLEALLEEYKNANHDLESEVESLRGGSSSSSSRRSWKQLSEDVERFKAEKTSLEKGISVHIPSNFQLILGIQRSKNQNPLMRPILKKSNRSLNGFSNLVVKSLVAATYLQEHEY